MTTVQYQGIPLDPPAGQVSLTHSISLDAIQGTSSTKNMDWTDILGNLPWGALKEPCAQAFENTSRLFSLLHMDYQVCNGGIAQYFYNRYDQERDPYSEHDVALYDIDVQKEEFLNLVKFAREIFPQRTQENEALARAAHAFEQLHIERDAEVSETVYCEEDEYILDEETGEEILNPDYFEPYDEPSYEDVIHGDNNFDDIFYQANGYMEELLELYAQYQSKVLAKGIGNLAPEIADILREHLPAAAFENVTLSSKISSAQSRTTDDIPDQTRIPKEPEL